MNNSDDKKDMLLDETELSKLEKLLNEIDPNSEVFGDSLELIKKQKSNINGRDDKNVK